MTPPVAPGASAGRQALSLRRQLLAWLLLPQLVLWIAVATLAYRIALNYALKGIDQSLTQSVRSLARQVKPAGSGLYIDFPRAAQAIMEEDPGDPVSYMVSSPPGRFILGNVGRNLLPLEREGLVEIGPGATDRRRREVRLSAAGAASLTAARQGWAQAQQRFDAVFGPERAAALRDLLREVVASDFAAAGD